MSGVLYENGPIRILFDTARWYIVTFSAAPPHEPPMPMAVRGAALVEWLSVPRKEKGTLAARTQFIHRVNDDGSMTKVKMIP